MQTTPNYHLPIFEQGESPAWLGDWNSTMQKIDQISGGGGAGHINREYISLRKDCNIIDEGEHYYTWGVELTPDNFPGYDNLSDKIKNCTAVILRWALTQFGNEFVWTYATTIPFYRSEYGNTGGDTLVNYYPAASDGVPYRELLGISLNLNYDDSVYIRYNRNFTPGYVDGHTNRVLSLADMLILT